MIINSMISNFGGDSANIEALSITQNGTYTASNGVDGYSPVTVNVSGGSADVVDVRWWGGIEPELIGETLWSKSPTEAANWPITPSFTSQNLTWITEYTATANANATIDKIGNGYHGVTEKLDFGTYNYIFFNDAYAHFAYTVDEATMGKLHIVHEGFSYIHHYGSSPRSLNGQIIRPSENNLGSYNSIEARVAQTIYRAANNSLSFNTTAAYGINMTQTTVSMSPTSTVKPNYFNIRVPTFAIRASNSYMPVDSYNYLDWSETTINYRCRIYRVPVEYGLYTQLQDRLLDMIQDETFPTASDTIWAASLPSANGGNF